MKWNCSNLRCRSRGTGWGCSVSAPASQCPATSPSTGGRGGQRAAPAPAPAPPSPQCSWRWTSRWPPAPDPPHNSVPPPSWSSGWPHNTSSGSCWSTRLRMRQLFLNWQNLLGPNPPQLFRPPSLKGPSKKRCPISIHIIRLIELVRICFFISVMSYWAIKQDRELNWIAERDNFTKL